MLGFCAWEGVVIASSSVRQCYHIILYHDLCTSTATVLVTSGEQRGHVCRLPEDMTNGVDVGFVCCLFLVSCAERFRFVVKPREGAGCVRAGRPWLVREVQCTSRTRDLQCTSQTQGYSQFGIDMLFICHFPQCVAIFPELFFSCPDIE